MLVLSVGESVSVSVGCGYQSECEHVGLGLRVGVRLEYVCV